MKKYRSKYINFDGKTLIIITKYADRMTIPAKLFDQLQEQMPENIVITDARGTPRGKMDAESLKKELASAIMHTPADPKSFAYYVVSYAQLKEYGTKIGKSGPIKVFSKEEIKLMNSRV